MTGVESSSGRFILDACVHLAHLFIVELSLVLVLLPLTVISGSVNWELGQIAHGCRYNPTECKRNQPVLMRKFLEFPHANYENIAWRTHFSAHFKRRANCSSNFFEGSRFPMLPISFQRWRSGPNLQAFSRIWEITNFWVWSVIPGVGVATELLDCPVGCIGRQSSVAPPFPGITLHTTIFLVRILHQIKLVDLVLKSNLWCFVFKNQSRIWKKMNKNRLSGEMVAS